MIVITREKRWWRWCFSGFPRAITARCDGPHASQATRFEADFTIRPCQHHCVRPLAPDLVVLEISSKIFGFPTINVEKFSRFRACFHENHA